jgi:hypothetical protein
LPPALLKSKINQRENKEEFLIEFDEALCLQPFWVDYNTLRILNSLRDDVQVNSIFDLLKSKRNAPHRRTESHLSIAAPVAQVTRSRKHLTNSIQTSPRKELALRSKSPMSVSVEENDDEFGYCHHCKQRKSKYILAHCNYNSELYGAAIPSSKTVNNYTVYNIDVFNMAFKNSFNPYPNFSNKHSICQEQYLCTRLFCSFCLKTNYDTDHAVASK